MNVLLDLPEPLLLELATEWLHIFEIGKIDVAVCNKSGRPKFISFVDLIRAELFSPVEEWVSAPFLHWLMLRKIYLKSARIINNVFNQKENEECILFQCKLQSLSVGVDVGFHSLPVLCKLVRLNPSLTDVVLQSSAFVDNDFIGLLATSCPKITSLDISGCWKINGDGIFSLCPGCPEITHLDVTGLTAMSWQSFECIGNNLTKLKSINFYCKVISRQASMIRAMAMLLMLSKFESIERLDTQSYGITGVGYKLREGETKREFKPILEPGW